MSVQVFDLVLLLLLAVSAYFSARRGFVDETLSIVGWVLAVFATLFFGPWAAAALHHSISPAWIGTIAGYAFVFMAVLLSVTFMTSWVSRDTKRSRLGPLDSVLGAAFGILRGLVVVTLIYMAFSMAIPPRHQPDWLVHARAMPVIRKTAEILVWMVPNDSVRRRLPKLDAAAGGAQPAPAPAPGKSDLRPAADEDESAPTPAKVAAPEGVNKNDKYVMPEPRPKQVESGSRKPPAAKHRKAGYGTQDREALDRLIEKSGKGDSGKP